MILMENKKKHNILISLLVVLFFLIASLSSVFADDFSSENFKVRNPIIDIFGGSSTSTSFQQLNAGGQTIIGESTSTNFILRSGFLYYEACGNGTVEGSEQCDGANLNSQTCVSQGYADGGTLSCKTDCTFNVSACSAGGGGGSPGGGGGGGGGGYIPSTTAAKVILQGKAYPSAKITILIDGAVATLINADSLANFKTEITTLTAGVYTFGLWAEDKAGRRSITFSFTITVTKDMTTTVSNIFLPPTIELEKVNILKGEEIDILGQTAPESEITISIESSQELVKKTAATKGGDWKHTLDTSSLDEGAHTTRVKAETPEGLLSSYSKVLAFYIGKYGTTQVCPGADFNKDGRTNLVDFSILLYWWGKYNPCVDLNGDGIVNLPDFSILMYYWAG